jgi:tRNA A-37 threonylcarbamoyl transferase component Bud32
MPTTTPLTGQPDESLFGNFEILRDANGNPALLGRGTFGRTYQARHRYLETIVALKIISERFAQDATARQRFLTEARAAAKLSHPHIARLYDFGEKGGVLFYAMEYCAGGDLADYVKKNGPLPPSQVIEVALQLAGALHCAHSAGLVHRDIKPSNVMLAGAEDALATKLIDFGLVHVHGPAATSDTDEDAASHTRLLGTPLFASPEQLREEAVDARADLFSLGMTLWFLALGESPEKGSLHEITASRLGPESYHSRLPDRLSGQLRFALARLVEKEPSRRFATAAEFLHALGHDARAGAGAVIASSAQVEEPTAAEPEVQAFDLEKVEGLLASQWQIGGRHNETFTGINYPATVLRQAKETAWLHVLNGALVNDVDLLWRVRLNAARFAALQLPGLFSPLAVRGYSDFTAVVLEKPDSTALLTAVQGQSAAVIADILEKIADACDAVSAAWLPGVDLQAADIWLQPANGTALDASTAQPKLFPRFLAAREAANLAEASGGTDVSSTVTTEMFTSPASADDMRAQFARLIYRLSAGRNCPAAASLASQAYVAVPNLSEQANRTLALVIARKREFASCIELLHGLRRSEGVGAPSSSQATRPRSTSAPRPSGATPPSVPSLAKSDVTWATRGTATAPVVEPPQPPVSFREAVAPPPPPRPHVARPKRTGLVLAGAVLAALFVGITVYRLWLKPEKPSLEPPKQAEVAASFPAETKLRIASSGLPKHATFSIAGKKVDPQRDGADLTLGLGGIPRRFPLEVSVEAKGFKKTAIALKDEADLAISHSLSEPMYRSSGKIMFVGPASDYTHASISMKALLPDEKDLDQIKLLHAPRGTEIGPGRKNWIEVPTGIYAITLSSDNGRSVRPRFFPKQYEIKADATQPIPLPVTFVGRYAGTVSESTDRSKQFELQIVIESGLSNGELTERRGSSTQKGSWSDGTVGSDGLYRAQVNVGQTESGNVTLVLRSVDEKKIALAPEALDSGASGADDRAKSPAYPAAGELEKMEATR